MGLKHSHLVASQGQVVSCSHASRTRSNYCNFLACGRGWFWELGSPLLFLLCICDIALHVADRHGFFHPGPTALAFARAWAYAAKAPCKRGLLPYLVRSLKLLAFGNQGHEILYRDVCRALRLAWRHTVAAVIGHQQVDAHFPCLVNLAALYCHNHTFPHLGGTGWDKVTLAALYFDCTDKAAGEGLKPLGVAQGGDIEAQFAGCFQYCGSLGNCNIYSVYFKINIAHIR